MSGWDGRKTFELIKLYELNPCLYDAQSPDYHNREKKKTVLRNIAQRLEITELEVLRKLKYLRTNYADKEKKRKTSLGGMGTRDCYEAKWRFHSALSFLENHVNLKLNAFNESEHKHIVEEDADSAYAQVMAVSSNPSTFEACNPTSGTMDSEGDVTETDEHVKSLQDTRAKTKILLKKRNQASNIQLVQPMKSLQNFFEAQTQKLLESGKTEAVDEDAAFSRLVERLLGKIKCKRKKLMLQKDIMNIIYDAVLEDQDSP